MNNARWIIPVRSDEVLSHWCIESAIQRCKFARGFARGCKGVVSSLPEVSALRSSGIAPQGSFPLRGMGRICGTAFL